MDDGDGGAPVALARDAPVTQTVLHVLAAQALVGQLGCHRVHRILVALAVQQRAGIHADAVLLVGIPLLPLVRVVGLVVHADDLTDGQAILVGKDEIAVVVRRHAHHRTVAVAHQHVVAHPHRHVGAGERMADHQARVHTLFLHRGQIGFHGRAGTRLFHEGSHRGAGGCGHTGDRVLRGHGHEGDAHDRVGARGEHVQPAVIDGLTLLVTDVVLEGKAHAFRTADPVGLHHPHPLGPSLQMLGHFFQQLAGVVGDAQVVHRDVALFHRRARAPAPAVDHLLVGQHGLVDRVPVDGAVLAIGNALFAHAQEQPLVPLVVVGAAGGHFARPVDGQAQRLHLLLHVRDVVPRPLGRGHTVLECRVLGRQAEGVPAHGHQHVVAAHAQVAVHHVVDGVVAHMPHVQDARGVGQHRAGVELALGKARVVLDGAVGVGLLPVGAGLGFDASWVVTLVHGGAWLFGQEKR